MSELRTVAALYVDMRGVYATMPGVECWDEARDAREYQGPHPVVAHPPCGPWSRLKHFCTKQPRDCAVIAIAQVRRFGGVLEHPEGSSLWREAMLPVPGGLPDEYGGWSVSVDQCHWGHAARKRTWLYVVGASARDVRLATGGTPTHVVTTSRANRISLPEMPKSQRHLTPPAFAEFLVDIARRSHV